MRWLAKRRDAKISKLLQALLQIHDGIKFTFGEKNKVMHRFSNELSLLPLAIRTEKALRRLRKKRNSVYANTTMPQAQKELIIKKLERQMKVIIDKFNFGYIKRMN